MDESGQSGKERRTESATIRFDKPVPPADRSTSRDGSCIHQPHQVCVAEDITALSRFRLRRLWLSSLARCYVLQKELEPDDDVSMKYHLRYLSELRHFARSLHRIVELCPGEYLKRLLEILQGLASAAERLAVSGDEAICTSPTARKIWVEVAREGMLAIVADSRSGSDFVGGLSHNDVAGVPSLCTSFQMPMPIQEERAFL